MSDDRIHEMYRRLQQEQIRKNQILYKKVADNPPGRITREPSLTPRFNNPSARARSFRVGEGFKVVASGSTALIAQLSVPAQHSGLLTGIIQIFPEQDCEPAIVNSVTWQLRVNGLPVPNFDDFIGQFSTGSSPMQVNIPLYGSDTLGTISVSAGGGPVQQVPTIGLYVVNNFDTSVVLQAKLIGYTFATAEIPDEFGSY